jgi:hypothetical protein
VDCCFVQISMYINSPGGVVTAGLAIYDTMQVRSSSPTANCNHTLAPVPRSCCVSKPQRQLVCILGCKIHRTLQHNVMPLSSASILGGTCAATPLSALRLASHCLCRLASDVDKILSQRLHLASYALACCVCSMCAAPSARCVWARQPAWPHCC